MRSRPDGMDAYWVMPFRHKCEITFHNLGTQPVRLCDGRVRHAPWKWNDRSMHFGASWHQYGPVSTGRDKHQNTDDTGDPSDLRFVALDGQGVYVGDGLTLFNTEYAWWGEGDEKSMWTERRSRRIWEPEAGLLRLRLGTARERCIIDHPFIAQPEGAGADSAGFVQNTRLRVLDGIPFRTSLRFDMGSGITCGPSSITLRRLTGTCVRAGASLVGQNEKEAAPQSIAAQEDLFRRKWR